MKRCPQCEFIYEDDQSFCDMDGTKLAHDSRPLPKLQALSTAESVSKSKLRGRVVPVFASATLAIVLGLVYYVSTRPMAGRATSAPSSTAAEVPSNTPVTPLAVATPEASASKEPPQANSNNGSRAEVKNSPENRRQTMVRKPSPTPPPRVNPKRPIVLDRTDEDDSKVRSIVKKTGRFLKKTLPF